MKTPAISDRPRLAPFLKRWMGPGLILLAVALIGWGAESEAREPSAPAGASAAGAQPQRQPNFVVVTTDDQTIHSLGLMPQVHRLFAGGGMTFTHAFVTTPQCCPSRTSYLTGQYSHNHGVLLSSPSTGGYNSFADKGNILPAWLQSAGYQTAHVGKYLNGYGIASLGNSPTEIPPGWDYWVVPANHTEYQMYGYTLNVNGALHQYGSEPAGYQTDVLAKQADAFLRGNQGQQPFFLNVAPVAPHSESVLGSNAPRNPRPAPRDVGAYGGLPFPRPPSFGVPVNHAPAAIQRKEARKAGQISARSLRPAFIGRSESLLAVDDLVGRLTATLRSSGQLRNTYFIFTSDNGFLLGEHGLEGKVLPYDESVRVPLLVRGPGIKPGSRDNSLVANIDLAPTISALAGAQPGRQVDGQSLVPLLRGHQMSPRPLELEYLAGREGFHAVRTQTWMFDRYKTGGSELYDVRNDPYQLHNLAANPRYAAVRSRLAAKLKALAHCSGATCR